CYLFVAKQDENVVEKEVDAAQVQVTTAATAPTILIHEVTLAQALAELKHTKPKVKPKGIVFHKLEESTKTTTSTIPKSKSQDKGKGIMVEEHVKLKKKDQIQLDEEVALKLQANYKLNLITNNNLVNTFVDYKTELVEESSKKAKVEVMEGSSKRAGTELEQESSKKQKIDDDKEIAELKQLVKIIPDEEGVAIDAIPLVVKPPSIVDWKIHKEGKKSYYHIIRADGSSKIYLVFSHMFKSFDREDMKTLWKLVKAKHGSIRPKEGYERVL
nr:hypothetical protein [Tanacetum cinerariifolium]